MHRSVVVLYAVSAFALAPAAPASTPDKIFADGFEFHDFPADPIIDTGAPSNASALFGATGAPILAKLVQ